MYISRVRLENIRGFSGPRNVDLTLTRPDGTHAGWTVIAGRNGSGKTSLLRAMAISVSTSFAAPTLMPDLRDWITAGQSEAAVASDLYVDPDVDEWPEDANREPATFTINRQWVTPPGPGSSGKRTVQPLPVVSTRRPFIGKLATGSQFGWFCAAYGPFRRLIGGSAEAQRLMQAPNDLARMATLFNEDASLAEGVQWLIDQHLRSLEDKPGAEELKRSALAILADGLLPDKYQVSRVDSDGLWVVRNGDQFPLREMSDGYRTVAALVVDLMKQLGDAYGSLSFQVCEGIPTISSPGTVIIDEVDAHLHVSWQKRIGGWLKAHFPNIQFIVTTHSPYICQSADPGGLIRLPGPQENEPPRVVEQALYDRIVFGSGEDAVLSELFGLDSHPRQGSGSPAGSRRRRHMIRIARAELPDGVSERLATLTKRIANEEQTKRAAEARRIWRLTSTRTHVRAPLDQVLRRMAPGLGQCMYCGDTGTGIDHFKPITCNAGAPGILGLLREPGLRRALLS